MSFFFCGVDICAVFCSLCKYFRILLGAVGLIFVLLFVVYLLMLSYPARCHWLHRRFSPNTDYKELQQERVWWRF